MLRIVEVIEIENKICYNIINTADMGVRMTQTKKKPAFTLAEVMIVPRCVKGMNRLLVTSRINRRMYAIRARIESFASRTNMSILLRMQMLQ